MCLGGWVGGWVRMRHIAPALLPRLTLGYCCTLTAEDELREMRKSFAMLSTVQTSSEAEITRLKQAMTAVEVGFGCEGPRVLGHVRRAKQDSPSRGALVPGAAHVCCGCSDAAACSCCAAAASLAWVPVGRGAPAFARAVVPHGSRRSQQPTAAKTNFSLLACCADGEAEPAAGCGGSTPGGGIGAAGGSCGSGGAGQIGARGAGQACVRLLQTASSACVVAHHQGALSRGTA